MHNPAGLKTADGQRTATFPDWATGVTAHLDHLALYAGATGYPRADTPDQRPFPFLHGLCPTVESLGGHYAPDPAYGTSIVADYLTPMLATKETAPMAPRPSFATWRGSPNVGGTPIRPPNGLVVHVEVGTEAGTNVCFQNPNFQASAHFGCAADGSIDQWVDVDQMAWAEVAGNPGWISVETEGTPDTPLTAAQVAAVGRLFAWLRTVWPSIPAQTCDHDGQGLTTHAHYPSGVADPDWGGHPCPGTIRSAQLPAILAAAEPAAPPPPTPAPVSLPPVEVDMNLVPTLVVIGPLDANGHGWDLYDGRDPKHPAIPFAEAFDITPNGSDPATPTGYIEPPRVSKNNNNGHLEVEVFGQPGFEYGVWVTHAAPPGS